MKILSLLIVGIGAAIVMASSAAARNYDCTKAGNANKAACKSATVPAPAKASAASAAVPAAVMPAASASKRTYDCTKPGNANKAACKASASTAAPAPIIAAPAAAPKPAVATRNYDCTKAGNANKAACKATTAASSSAPTATAAPVPAAPRKPTAVTPVASGEGNPAGPVVFAANGARIVPWTTKSGKLVHYDCSKAGNLNKRACKQ